MAVAQNSGKERIKGITSLTARMAAGLGILGGLATYVFSAKIPLLFVKDPAFITTAVDSLRMLAPLLTVSSVMDVLDSALISSGDGIFNTLTTSAAASICALYLVRGYLDSVGAVWMAVTVSYFLRLSMNILRFCAIFGSKTVKRRACAE